MPTDLTRLFVEEKGQGMTEYGLILGVIAMGVIVVIYACRQQITALFQGRLDNLKNNVPPLN
jgi:pilus assembly protein Flp/PilA